MAWGRLMREAPPERVEQVMRSPARKPILDAIFWQTPKQLDSSQAANLNLTVRWCITGNPDGGVDTYSLQLWVRRPDAAPATAPQSRPGFLS